MQNNVVDTSDQILLDKVVNVVDVVPDSLQGGTRNLSVCGSLHNCDQISIFV